MLPVKIAIDVEVHMQGYKGLKSLIFALSRTFGQAEEITGHDVQVKRMGTRSTFCYMNHHSVFSLFVTGFTSVWVGIFGFSGREQYAICSTYKPSYTTNML